MFVYVVSKKKIVSVSPSLGKICQCASVIEEYCCISNIYISMKGHTCGRTTGAVRAAVLLTALCIISKSELPRGVKKY